MHFIIYFLNLFLPVSLYTHTFTYKHMTFETLLKLNTLWHSIPKYISMCLLTILHLTECIYFYHTILSFEPFMSLIAFFLPLFAGNLVFHGIL